MAFFCQERTIRAPSRGPAFRFTFNNNWKGTARKGPGDETRQDSAKVLAAIDDPRRPSLSGEKTTPKHLGQKGGLP